MSKANTSKNDRHACEETKAKSIDSHNPDYTLLLAVSMASLLAMCVSSLPAFVNIAYAQTASHKCGTIANTQSDQASTWKLSGTWNFNNLNSNSPTFTSTFSMVKTDGSGMHKHTINDFKLTANPTKTRAGTTYTGTATVSMRGDQLAMFPLV